MARLAVWLRALQPRGAELPVRAPAGCADLLALFGLPLMAGGMKSEMLTGGWR